MTVYRTTFLECNQCGQSIDSGTENEGFAAIRERGQREAGWWRDGPRDFCTPECMDAFNAKREKS